jgi:hypothetical protein
MKKKMKKMTYTEYCWWKIKQDIEKDKPYIIKRAAEEDGIEIVDDDEDHKDS